MGHWGRFHSPRLSVGPCRYRCLVDLQHNLPASGDMCVSVLSRLCTVMPNMYRVGISKVSATPRSVPGGPKFKGPRTGACGIRNAQAKASCPRGNPVELGKWIANSTSRPLLRQSPRLMDLPPFFHFSKHNPSFTLSRRLPCLFCLHGLLEREGSPVQSRGPSLPQSLPPVLSCSLKNTSTSCWRACGNMS